MENMEVLPVIDILGGKNEAGNESLSANFVISDTNPQGLELLSEPSRLNGGAFAICTRGECTLSLNLNSYPLKANMVTVITSGTIVQISRKSEDFRGFLIGFSADFTEELDFKSLIPFYATIQENPCLELTPESARSLIQFFTFMGDRIRRGTVYNNKEIIQHLMLALFYEVSALYQKHQPELTPRKMTRQEMVCKQLLRLVVEHHRQERSVAFYASKLCMTPKYLSSLVRKVSGSSVVQWINYAVILDAKTLLKSSSLTVQQISDYMNFPNPSFFGRYFKQHTGLTPRQYQSGVGQ